MNSLFRYYDLLHTKCIDVWPKQEGGYQASVSFLDTDGKVSRFIEKLPLVGIPSLLLGKDCVKKLSNFLKFTYLVPEKGGDGAVDRVSVRVACRAGGLPKIPFQPGLALGSVVSGNVMAQLQEYGDAKAKKDRLEDQIKSAEQEIATLDTKIASRKDKGDNDSLVVLWKAQQASVGAYSQGLVGRLMSLMPAQNEVFPIPVIESFSQGIASPIDVGSSVIEIQPRGFDSENFNSQYILINTAAELIQDKISQSSRASSAFAGGGHLLFGSVEFNRTKTSAVLDRIMQAKAKNEAKGVLVIDAFVTTRNVRCFTKINYDLTRLKQVLAVMKGKEAAEKIRYGITEHGGSQAIFLLTEAVMGGSFTALVFSSGESESDRDLDGHQTDSSSSGAVGVEGRHLLHKANVGYMAAGSSGSKSEKDALSGSAQTRVSIEFFAQGAIPTLSRSTIEREILKHLNLDPSKYELSSSDASNLEKIVKASGQEREIALLQQDAKVKSQQVAILNAVRGMVSEKQKQNIHTMESVMGAYENFAERIANDKECGVPIGFNYTVLTQQEIEAKIKELEKDAV